MESSTINTVKSSSLEAYFAPFRHQVIGEKQNFRSPFGEKPIVYADWTASGRLYDPIEDKIKNDFGPFVANTHTETTASGTAMTQAYQHARKVIKNHVNATEDDVLIMSGNGMTGAVNKFQRILGLKVPEGLKSFTDIPENVRPVVFISHMEHHSNQTSWLETISEVEVVPPNSEGLFSLEALEHLLNKHKNNPLKIASVTAASNVTGLKAPYYKIAALMHKNQGLCFVDFACAAPYIDIDIHPKNPGAYLDAIVFSPHKFLGGPGTSGVLIFNRKIYKNLVPDCPGGGTVMWTNPWGEHKYIENIEEREDGGTPGFLQTIRTALAIKLKEQMGVKKILKREKEIVERIFDQLEPIKNIHILAGQHRDRLGVISFYIDDLHYNLGVKMLNDRFGIQTRGGCSCAGTYGHFLLHVDIEASHKLTSEISAGELSRKPGWIRLSIHPIMTNQEVDYICNSIMDLAQNHQKWGAEYSYIRNKNEFEHHNATKNSNDAMIESWFELN